MRHWHFWNQSVFFSHAKPQMSNFKIKTMKQIKSTSDKLSWDQNTKMRRCNQFSGCTSFQLWSTKRRRKILLNLSIDSSSKLPIHIQQREKKINNKLCWYRWVNRERKGMQLIRAWNYNVEDLQAPFRTSHDSHINVYVDFRYIVKIVILSPE